MSPTTTRDIARTVAERHAIDRAQRYAWQALAPTFREHMKRFDKLLEHNLEIFLRGIA